MRLVFLVLRIHHHDLIFRNLFRHLLFIECHIVEWISGMTSLDCFVVRQHVLFDDWVDFLSAAYLQLLLKIGGHIAHLLFHVVHKVRLALEINFLVGDKFIEKVREEFASDIQTGRRILKRLAMEEREGVGE